MAAGGGRRRRSWNRLNVEGYALLRASTGKPRLLRCARRSLVSACRNLIARMTMHILEPLLRRRTAGGSRRSPPACDLLRIGRYRLPTNHRCWMSVAYSTTLNYMTQPTSLRFPDPVKDRLDQAAARTREKPSSLAVRLIDEGLRMAEHPGVTFHNSPAHGRVAALAGGPDVAEVIDVLTGLKTDSEQRIDETAEWFDIHPSKVRIAMGYYTAFTDEIDRQIDQRRREAAELRERLQAQQTLLE